MIQKGWADLNRDTSKTVADKQAFLEIERFIDGLIQDNLFTAYLEHEIFFYRPNVLCFIHKPKVVAVPHCWYTLVHHFNTNKFTFTKTSQSQKGNKIDIYLPPTSFHTGVAQELKIYHIDQALFTSELNKWISSQPNLQYQASSSMSPSKLATTGHVANNCYSNNKCDCGGAKANTTHSHWCSTKK